MKSTNPLLHIITSCDNISEPTLTTYKGVLLNNFFQNAAKLKQKSSFVCGVVSKPLGVCHAHDNDETKSKVNDESNIIKLRHKEIISQNIKKKRAILTKHRKWLEKLKNKREEEKVTQEIEKLEKEEKKQRFTKREEEKRRRYIKKSSHFDEPNLDFEEKEAYVKETKPYYNFNGLYKNDENTPTSERNSVSKILSKKKITSGELPIDIIPKWACTESKAIEIEEKEDFNILSFVQKLDFDKYAHDLEVNVLMKQLNEKIDILESEQKQEENLLEKVNYTKNNDEVQETKVLQVFETKQTNADIVVGGAYKSDSVCFEHLLHQNLGQIHSHKSCGSLIQKTLEEDRSEVQQQDDNAGITPPLIISHKDDKGVRLTLKESLDKLPYKNKNPCI